MVVVIDTSALIAWERALEVGGTVDLDADVELILPAIVWAEALAGVRLADSVLRATRRLARLETMRRLAGVEPFTAEIAEHHADIFAELTRQGTMIPQNDLSIAATARALGATLLVGPNDEAHFRQVRDLPVRVLRRA